MLRVVVILETRSILEARDRLLLIEWLDFETVLEFDYFLRLALPWFQSC